MTDTTAFVGTYTDGDSAGIYRCRFGDRTDGWSLAGEATNPSYLCIHPSGQFLYAVNEVDDGMVAAFEIGAEGELSFLDSLVIGPADPCHCSVAPSGEFLFVAHYSGGAISATPIESDGSLGGPSVLEHEGSSVDPDRQTEPHPHTIRPGPDGKYVYVADLGADEILRYTVSDAGSFTRAGTTALHDGAGPRQFDFGPDGRLYCVNELDSTLSTFEIAEGGTLTHLETVGTIPSDFAGENAPGAVEVHPSGRHLYASNRGHDSIAAFAITEDGLDRLAITSTGGAWPRDFTIGPDGDRLHVANAHSDSVVTFRIEETSGRLERTDVTLAVPDPVCVRPR